MKPTLLRAAAVLFIGVAAFIAGRSSISPGSGESSNPDGHLTEGVTSSQRAIANAEQGRSSARNRASLETASLTRATTKEERLARLEGILRNEDPLARNRALLDYLDQLDPSELQDAVERFRMLDMTDERSGEYAMLLVTWAKADPTTALAYAIEKTEGSFATNTILSTWATNDPEAAIAWAKMNHDGDEANPYMVGIIRGIASTDTVYATSLLTDMPMSEERGDALEGLLPHMLAKGAAATMEWIASINDDSLKGGAVDRAIEQLAAEDPKATADWLIANVSDSVSRNIDDVLQTWMESDPTAATDYFKSLPPGNDRTNALRGVVNTLAETNPREAAAFLEQYPGDVTDRVISQFVWNSLSQDPSFAVNYIGQIEAQNVRDGMYRRAINSWMRHDAQAAREFLQNHPLPPSMQNYVRQRLNQ